MKNLLGKVSQRTDKLHETTFSFIPFQHAFLSCSMTGKEAILNGTSGYVFAV